MAYIGKSPSTGVRNRFIYTATAGQTTFSGTDDHNRTLSYTDAEFTDVFLNGVKLDKSDYTAASGTSIVLDEGAAVDDILEVLAFDTFSVFSGEFSADVTVGGTLTANGNVDVTGDATVTGDLTVDTNTLHVDSTNNRVGVGTTSPSSILHLSAPNDPIITLTDTDHGGSADITGSNGNLRLNSGTATLFDIADSEIARFDSAGDFYIGRTSGNPSTSAFGARINSTGFTFFSRDVNGGSASLRVFGNAGEGRIMGDGDLQNTNNSYGQISDETLKQDIVDAASQWDDIKDIRVRKFRFKDNPEGVLQIGVIAQELEASGMNGLVKDVMLDDDDEGTEETVKSVKYSVLYMKAIKALQEAMERIETLETKVAALEAE